LPCDVKVRAQAGLKTVSPTSVNKASLEQKKRNNDVLGTRRR